MKLNIIFIAFFSLLCIGEQDLYALDVLPMHSIESDTIPLKERYGNFLTGSGSNFFDLRDPSIIEQEIEYDPATGQYIITEKIGSDYFRAPTYMTFSEYVQWRSEQQERQYFNQLAGISDGTDGISGRIDPVSKLDLKESLIDRLFGGNTVDIRPQGNIDLTFGVNYNKVDNPIIPIQNRARTNFDFDMNIRMNVTGKIGEKLTLTTNYNTGAVFDFDNVMKIDYNSDLFSEDQILKKIEAGNVSLPLKSNLIQGTQNLFGIKTELQFGKLKLTSIISNQKSQRENIQLQNGAEVQEYEVPVDEYDENKHFFLTHFNRNTFEPALSNLPQIRSLFRILRMEVWITNDRNQTEGGVRDIVAFTDIGEPDRVVTANPTPYAYDINGVPLPDNASNDLYANLIANSGIRAIDEIVNGLQSGQIGYPLEQVNDFEKVRARKLSSSEYDVNNQLGFVSLKVNVQPDQVVGVAFEYEYNGRTYRVGELSNQNPQGDSLNVLYVKMLKSSTAKTNIPYWDLMMKNIYFLGSSQVDREDFRLDIFYDDAGNGQKRFLPGSNLENIPLIRVFNLDELNVQGDPQADGVFDFVEGLTINSRTGRVMFPVLEPFGSYLEGQLDNPGGADSVFLFKELYSTTQFRAQEYLEKNRFSIRGNYRSSGPSSEISLGAFNIPRNSVRVSAGGVQLQEGSDYEVDYNIGKIRILNDAYLQPGQPPINVSFEENTFAFNQKSMIGVRADYELNKNLGIGATYMHLYERPYTQKVNIGDDPINNRILGLDLNYSKEAPWLTRLVDKIPLISTKEPSSITFVTEVAGLKPGHSKAINQDGDEGIVYIDDFEGSTTNIDLRTPSTNWHMSSIPQNMVDSFGTPMITESQFVDDLRAGANRALMNWYRLDITAKSDADATNPYTRDIQRQEIFPRLEIDYQYEQSRIYPLEIHYQPQERAPYNFDEPNGISGISEGLTNTGHLRSPDTRWGGIMRPIRNSDFEASNIEFVEFWMLSPFLGNYDIPNNDGVLYLQLGNMSEDIMRDSRMFFENGLIDGVTVDQTSWSNVPRTQQITYAFDNNDRASQDIGLDGSDDSTEQSKFAAYLAAIQNSNLNADAKTRISNDPSGDNFISFRDPVYTDNTSALDRYKYFNGPEGNSKESSGQFVESSTNYPNTEDLNRDNSLNETEAYYQYNVPLIPAGNGEIVWNRFINDSIVVDANGSREVWYNFKIPLNQYDHAAGGIQDFRSIRFLRMVMAGFESDVILRFATLELVRNQWRRYSRNTIDCPDIKFEVNEVNIEENSTKVPFNYVLPPGVTREVIVGAVQSTGKQNENSLALEIENLCSGAERGIFKNLNLDMRVYERMQLFLHGETEGKKTTGVTAFIRMGSDFTNNFYEYEIPLTWSEDGVDPNDIEAYRANVWPEANLIDFPLTLLRDIKLERNNLGLDSMTVADPNKPENNITVKGNPNIGYIKAIMIGVKNNDSQSNDPRNMEIWANELRLVGLNEKGGLAGLARMDIKLADFGSVALSGNYSSIGYGAIDEKLAERSREEIIQYDIAGNFELGKFLPEKSGIRLPFFAQYSKTINNPQFDPYDLDIELKDKIAASPNPKEVKELSQDVTTIKSFNFTNVRKDRTKKGIPMPWDVSNFSATYAYSETDKHNPLIAQDNTKRYRGGLDYQFSRKTKYIQPFKKLIKKDKLLKFITEFNFNPLPNSYGVSTTLDRAFNKIEYRFSGEDPLLNTYYNKSFLWDRNYDLNWDISKSLKFNFAAQTASVIDEPQQVDQNTGTPLDKAVIRDSIWTNIRDLGRVKSYRHNFGLNYDLPFKHFPVLDFVRAKASFTGDFNWNAAALNVQDLGNVIQNGQVRKINADLDLTKLYKKWGYLQKVDKSLGGSRGSSRRGTAPTRSARGSNSKADPMGGRNSRSRMKAGEKGKKGDQMDIPVDSPDPRAGNNPSGTAQPGAPTGKNNDSKADKKKTKKNKTAKKKKKKKERVPSAVEKGVVRTLLAIRKARFVYSEKYSTVVPGFTPSSKILGQNEGFAAPGWDFISGFQPNDAKLDNLANQNWITESIMLNQPLSRNFSQDFTGNVTIEPFKDFRIEVDVMRSFTDNKTEMFKDTLNDGFRDIVHALPREVGSYTISFVGLNTLFTQDEEGIFQQFEENTFAASRRLLIEDYEARGIPVPANLPEHSLDSGYVEGYGQFQQDVLIPAFFAAYTDQDVNTVKKDLFKMLPRPNWQLTYNGLSKLKPFKELFRSFSLKHGYKSSMTVNSFNTSIDFDDNSQTVNQSTSNYYSRFEIPDIAIREQFNPVIGVDMRLQNEMSFNFSYNKARNLTLSFIDYKLSETKTSDITFGFGYTLKNVELKFLKKKKKKPAKKKTDDTNPTGNTGRRGGRPKGKNLVIKTNFSLRDDVTYNHQLYQDATIATRGTKTLSLSPTVDYDVTERLTLQFFFDHRRTTPRTSASPPTVTTGSGITLRFNLGR